MAFAISRAISALSCLVDEKTGDAVLTLQTESGSAVSIRMHPGIVAGVAVALFSLGRKLRHKDDKGITSQAMQLTAAIPAITADGRVFLDLVLEGTTHFPVVFHPKNIPTLQRALAELQSRSSSGQSEPTQH